MRGATYEAKITDVDSEKWEAYNGRCRALIDAVAPYLGAEEVALQLEHVEANEGALAMTHIAWAIVEERIRVPAELIRELRDLRLEPEEYWPQNLDDLASAEADPQ